MSLEIAWRMAQAFFGDFMDPGFRGRSHEEDVRVLRGVGLTSAFWTG